MIGKTLVHYEISAQLGRGGMGEVYQAKDTKLGRDVAIKVLPEEFARDADRVARFQREAKLLASLNHPNIAAIYGLEESEGTHFLVMELIEGQTLNDRIKSGPIPVEEALKLALQMAEALEAAHEKGVIHRDFKPANIKVTPEGKVKVLDFGLAKAYAGDQENISPLDSPTISAAATQKGIILGTAAYMSPEQARGKPVDKRADIWAFGVVLYEMLTGRQVFSGETVSDTLASVLAREPEWNGLLPNLHPRIRFLLERCVEKDPKNRYSGISDARVDIQKALADPSGLFVQPSAITKPRKRVQLGLPLVATIALLCIIIAALAVWNLKPARENTVTRFPLSVPEGDLIPFSEGGVAISPDGTRIVYAANREGSRQLYLRNRNQIEPIPIANTENATHPFFSPDGEWIGFFTGNELKKVSLSGGPAQTLLAATYRRGASWGPDNTIVFASNDAPGLMRVSASGGEPRQFTSPEAGTIHLWPEFLPGGKAVLFTITAAGQAFSTGKVAVLSLETGEYKVLVDGMDAYYATSGHLVFGRESSLWAAPFDLGRRDMTGDPAPVEEMVQVNTGGWAHYALANDGTLVYMLETGASMSLIPVWVDRSGKEEPIVIPLNEYRDPIVSPDGTQVAMSAVTDGNTDIWVWDLVRETMSRLTHDGAIDAVPLWTPDGKRIAFTSSRDGGFDVYWVASDCTGDVEPLFKLPDRYVYPASWSADGDTLVLMEEFGSLEDIGAVSMGEAREHKVLLQEDYNETQPKISPDGRWMVYQSDESGRYEIYIRPFPDVSKGKTLVSTAGGTEPKWSPDGRELFYRNGDAVMVVSVRTEPTLSLEIPKILLKEVPYLFFLDTSTYWNVSADGKRFLIIKESREGASSAGELMQRINIVLNWFEELKERVPVD